MTDTLRSRKRAGAGDRGPAAIGNDSSGVAATGDGTSRDWPDGERSARQTFNRVLKLSPSTELRPVRDSRGIVH
jgi:hypothetical protein